MSERIISIDEAAHLARSGGLPCPSDAPAEGEFAPDPQRYREWITTGKLAVEKRTGGTPRLRMMAAISAVVIRWKPEELWKLAQCIRSDNNPPRPPRAVTFEQAFVQPAFDAVLRELSACDNVRLFGWMSVVRYATENPTDRKFRERIQPAVREDLGRGKPWQGWKAPGSSVRDEEWRAWAEAAVAE